LIFAGASTLFIIAINYPNSLLVDVHIKTS